MSAGDVLRLGYSSGSAFRVLTLGYGLVVEVEPPSSEDLPTSENRFGGMPSPTEQTQVVEVVFAVSGGGRFRVELSKTQRASRNEQAAALIFYMS